MKMVKAEGLTYEYTKIMETDHGTEEHRVVALKNVNIEIEKGEFVVHKENYKTYLQILSQ